MKPFAPGNSHPHLSCLSICSSPSASPFPVRYSPILLASVSLSHSPTPDEERAERRWRSDACEAPVSACLTRSRKTRVNALVTGMQTPHRFAQTGRTRLAFFAHHGRTRRAIDLRKPGNHPACMRRLAFPATGRSPFGAPRGISGPGPCSPLSGSPSRIVRRPCSTHGSSLPGGAGLANLPGAAANRFRRHHSLAPTYRIAS